MSDYLRSIKRRLEAIRLLLEHGEDPLDELERAKTEIDHVLRMTNGQRQD